MILRLVTLLLALSPFVVTLPASAQNQTIKIVAFAGASNWPLWVGQDKGLFAAHRLEVGLDITPNSIEMAKNLHQHRYDIAFSSVDNIVAYNEGQGEAALDGPAHFVALFGVDNGLLHVMAQPEITGFAALKGQRVSVDAMTTGYSFVLREVLKRKDIALTDVEWIKVGGGAQRLEALLKKEQAATLLNTPLDLAAEARGLKRLLSVQDELGAYQGIVAATTRSQLADKQDLFLRFIKAFHQSIAWLADPAHQDEALGILMAHMPTMQRAAAEKAYSVLLDEKNGIYRDMKISRDGMKTVLRLRSAYGLPTKQLDNPELYIDETVLDKALRQ